LTANKKSVLPPHHPPIPDTKIAVLLVNLGTPDACTPGAVRRYLAEFLSDRRVIELSPWMWQPILHGIILRTRPRKVAEAYREIWIHDSDESPLRLYTRRQAEQLAEKLAVGRQDLTVDWAMRYGRPSLSKRLLALQREGCQRILVVPLYPQYSATTTATVNDRVFDTLKSMRWQPAIRIMPPYHDHPSYINALVESIESHLAASERKPEMILASFHGLPQEYFDAGDPYHCHCAKTTRLLRERLGCSEDYLRMSFQSRFGPKQWLQPYTDQTLLELARNGVKRIAVVMPGFAADCLETLEEMGIQNRRLFLDNGGKDYTLIPCLNDSETGTRMLLELVRQELAGWI
jgi:ferrochelatase